MTGKAADSKKRASATSSAPSKKSKTNDKRKASKKSEEEEEERKSPEVEKNSSGHKSEVTSPLLVFAHGAGANSSHEWMLRWKKLLAEETNAVDVVTFDYPYCANGKKGAPPKAEKLVDSHIVEIEKAVSRNPGHPLVLVGKSMGSRVSCMVAGKEDMKVAAVVCLGYPLKGANGALRDQTLFELQAPVLFVQGSKDSMCPLTELEKVRKKMTVKSELHVVEGGDHSLKKGKRAGGLTQDESDQKALQQIGTFINDIITEAK